METEVLRTARVAAGARGVGDAEATDNGPDVPPPADEKHSDDYACIDVAVNVAVRVGEYWDSRTSWRSRLPRRGRGSGGEAAVVSRGEEAEPEAEAPEPAVVDVGTPEYATVWRPRVDGFREPRPGLLRSVVRAGGMVAYPTPLADLAAGAAELPLRGGVAEPEDAVAAVLPALAARPAKGMVTEPVSQQHYGEVRALVGVLVEVLAGRRPVEQVAVWLDAGVRDVLRSPDRVRFEASATLRRVRLSAVGGASADGGMPGDGGFEAMALVQDGARLRAVAFRFDRVVAAATDDGSERSGERRTGRGRSRPAWVCTALQAA